MSHVVIKRFQRDVSITLHTATSDSQTIRLNDMAGGVVSFGTMSTNAATLQMFGSTAVDGPYRQLYNADGSAANITLAPSSTVGRIYSLPDAAFALSYLRIVSGATNSTGTVGVVSLKT
jgi:hypothetical protein